MNIDMDWFARKGKLTDIIKYHNKGKHCSKLAMTYAAQFGHLNVVPCN